MDTVRELIAKRVPEIGETLKSVSLRLNRSHSYLQQFIKRGIPAKLPEDVRRELAAILSVEEERLGGPTAAVGTASGMSSSIGHGIALRTTVPAYGHARGGKDGQFVLNGNKVADVLAPPALSSVPDAYAVYVAGNSMEPRYFPGEVVFVHPRLPVRRGDFVVAQIAAGEGEPPLAYVKRFLSRNDGGNLRLEQLNPKKTLTFPDAIVVSVHRIIMGGEG
jgi:phage repressor protein C with HTH and peptisase S24 domain